ncbi:30S ribosomal protein S17 [bacterium DOLZORAL124_38_8]|nr:MAG: 30S ribosomal protein S17 [bacterium DOLZORAL124_38_8]
MITKKGTVTNISGEKTIKVEVHTYKAHPKYKKQYRVTKKFLVHDEKGAAKVGDLVQITQTRPISKRKHWILKAA